jgi:hypothetical protein
LIFLSVPDQKSLIELSNKASVYDIKHTCFNEPDIGNEITAVAFEPGKKSKKLCSRLPLALKNC